MNNKKNIYNWNMEIRKDGGLDDKQIRDVIKGKYAEKYTIIEEFQILKNTVVDLTIIGEKGLVGFEIKSSFDSIEKLHEQMADYIRFFHRVEVITTKHLADEVQEVLSASVYAKVGILVANIDEYGVIRFRRIRESYEIKHTKAHMDYMFNYTGMESKLRPHLRGLRGKYGITGETEE